MPTVPQSELPIPESWDEFEDIVADLYARAWGDPNTQRYGRSGQAQQGVDVYGRPTHLQGRYAGIQCKRYEGRLTHKKVKAEIAKAEAFSPPLAEYIIATTDHRDAKLQQIVRQIDEERRAAGKFSVHVIFWEELCSQLSHPANNDLLLKHYADWAHRFEGLASPSCTSADVTSLRLLVLDPATRKLVSHLEFFVPPSDPSRKLTHEIVFRLYLDNQSTIMARYVVIEMLITSDADFFLAYGYGKCKPLLVEESPCPWEVTVFDACGRCYFQDGADFACHKGAAHLGLVRMLVPHGQPDTTLTFRYHLKAEGYDCTGSFAIKLVPQACSGQ
jgi:hypothetical protein